MRAHDSSARIFRPGDQARVSPRGPMRDHALSRRDLLRAGAAGLAGLGLPMAAPLRARAADFCPNDPVPTCFPFGPNSPIVYTAGSKVKNPLLNPLLNCVQVCAPTLEDGKVCVTVTNNCGVPLFLAAHIFNAPNAGAFDCFQTNTYLLGQTLISAQVKLIPQGQSKVCFPVPDFCFQADFSPFQFDIAAFQADLALQNPGLGGVPVGIPIPLTDQNIVAGLLVAGNCPQQPCCIRMTGGGHQVTTVGGIVVESKKGFQLRTEGHSNLELQWTFGGVTHTFKVGPKDDTNLTCAFTPCDGGGGGQQPLNNPNTILGTLNGTLDGQPATAFINFVDCGEPGTNDTTQIIVFDGNGVPQVVASGKVQNGNIQAHKC